MPFITDEVKAKRAVSIEETNEKLKTLRRNEVSRFFKEGILALCQEVRNAAIGEYMITGKLPDEIRIYDRDLLITSAVAKTIPSVVRRSLRNSRASRRRFVTLNSDTQDPATRGELPPILTLSSTSPTTRSSRQ